MLQCTETITVVQEHYDAETDSQTYEATAIRNASWHAKTKIAIEGKGVVSADIVMIRIPEADMPAGLVIKNNDVVVRGEITTPITKAADLVPYNPMVVMSIGDNRRGRFPHWAVVGK